MSNLGTWDIEDFFSKIEVIHEVNKVLYDADSLIRQNFNNVTRLVDNSILNAEQATAGKIAYELETTIEVTETMKNRLILQLYGKHEVLVDRPLPIFFVDNEQQIQHKLDIYTNLSQEYVVRVPLLSNYDVAVILGTEFECIEFHGVALQKDIDAETTLTLELDRDFVFDDVVPLNDKVYTLGENGLLFFKRNNKFNSASHILFKFRSIIKKPRHF